MSLQPVILQEAVVNVAADLLLLKHAQHFYGADAAVAERLVNAGACSARELSPAEGEVSLVASDGAIAARSVMLVGTPPLAEFRYIEMRKFARKAIESLAQRQVPVTTLATTVHGAGYGLDVGEALQALLYGFQQGLAALAELLERSILEQFGPGDAALQKASGLRPLP